MILKILEIDWIDSTSYDAWDGLEEHTDAGHCIKTIGYLAKETKDFVIVVQNIDLANMDMSMSMRIPKGCIKKKRVVC